VSASDLVRLTTTNQTLEVSRVCLTRACTHSKQRSGQGTRAAISGTGTKGQKAPAAGMSGSHLGI